MIKRICSFALAFTMILSCFGFMSFAEDEIVKDGLEAWYDGKNNTKNGHNADSLVWEDLAGDNDITVIKDEKNYFTSDAYHLNSTKHNFPLALLDLVNGNEFTVELRLGEVKKIGGSFATFINSSENDNFALFLRHSGDYVEFKSTSNARPKVTGGMDYVTNSTLTITFKAGGKCSMYIDGILIGATNVSSKIGAKGDLFFGHMESGKTHEADYRGMRFYSRALSSDEVVQNAKADGTYDPSLVKNPYASVAQPSTNIIGDITLVEYVTSKAQLDAYKSAEFTPADAIFYLGEDLKVSNKEGNAFATLDEVFEGLDNKIIPIFYIKSNKTADGLIAYLEDKKIEDVTVMSDDKTVVKYARQKYTLLRGVIDYTEALKGKVVTQKELLDIRAECTSHLAKTAVLPAEVASRENVSYLNSRQITTWVMSEDNFSKTDALELILSEAYGIISSDPKMIYDTASEYFTKNSLVRSPGMIGHRGIPSTHPENTLEGAIAAYEAGADIIEVDIYLTIDNVIVINHDSQTTLYDKKLAVESCTLAKLKELDYNGCKLPTLEEYFKEFKGKDVMIFIEIKSQKPQIVTKMKELIEKYDVYGQCAVIAYEQTGQLPRMMEKYPEMPVGGLSSLTNSGIESTLPEITKFVGKYNTTFNPSYTGYDAEYIKESLARGITTWPYTINTPATILQFIGYGHAGITTNYVNVTGKMIKDIDIAVDNTDGQTKLYASSVTYNRTSEKESDAEFFIVEGDAATIENGVVTFTKEGSITVMAKVTKTLNGYNYSVYSSLLTLSSSNNSTPDTTVTPAITPDVTNPDDCGLTGDIPETEEPSGNKTIIFVIVGVVAVIGIVALIDVLVKKKRQR